MRNILKFIFFALAFLPGSLWSADIYVATPVRESSRFLLMDRPDPSRISGGRNEVEAETEPDLSDIPQVNYSSEGWNDVREQIESGRFRGEIPEPVAEVEVSTEAPAAPQPEVEFKDSGTSLSVTGRKVIALNYNSKRYLAEQTLTSRPRSLNLFEISQQMQVRMQGKVGQKITVNVDYDDTKVDKQDISVVYQGDPNDVVQNVSFGDIDLSLPSTEFVSYNKQVFGIRADLKSGGLKSTLIGSRTKGVTKTKQFTGNTQFQSVDIPDTNYLRRKYYDVTFGNQDRLPIKSGSERIYIDRQTQAIADGVTVFSLSAKDLAVQTSTYTGRFQIMNPGIDYVIDYIKGLVTFNRTLNPQDVVIVDFENGGLGAGTRLYQNPSTSTLSAIGYNPVTRPETYVLLKTPSDIFMSTGTEVGYNRELKTYYNIGQTNIMHNDGHGNFILKVKNLNRDEIGSNLNPPQTYPGTIEVDFEQGIFRLKEPFALDTDPTKEDSQLYSASPVSKRVFSVEYSYRFKTFLLEPGIVVQSDYIRIDGVKVNRNEDYFIDYDSGFITFYYPERIRPDSKIEIVYEVSPFGGIGNQSLVGGRISYDLGTHFSVGSTILYQGGIKSNTVPNITDLTNSMLVYEGDAQIKDINLLGLRTTLGGEVAQSRLNPNLNGFALIDNMEGVKQDDSPSLDANSWQIASNPPSSEPADPTAVTWRTEEIKAKVINPAATSEGTQQVLSVHYDFTVSSEVSIVYPLSPTGLDFSQKTALELVLAGDSAQGPLINIHLGQINEDADSTGGDNFVCAKGITLINAPKNEDTNCDGQLAPAEDVGWLYQPVGKNSQRYGARNGRLDSEDLNRNGRLDPQDLTGGDFGYVNFSSFTDNNASNIAKDRVDFTDYHTLYTPISIQAGETYRWSAIKQVRISLKYKDGPRTGIVKFARIAAVGNTWGVTQSAAGGGSIQVQAINNLDNPGYKPIYSAGGSATDIFNKLYGSVDEQNQDLSEQTLAIAYTTLPSSATSNIYRKFSRPIDVSQHKKLLFLMNKVDGADEGAGFFMQFGDENNYFRADVPFTALNSAGWALISIEQADTNRDGVPDVWLNGSNYTVNISSKGSPNLGRVPQITMGVAVSTGVHTGTVYVNEIHVAEPMVRVGNARKVEGSFEIPGWASFGGKHRYVDRNFQTPVMAITNQDNEQQTAYLNFTRLSFLPLNFTGARQIVTTPNTSATGSNNLVNSIQQGKVRKLDGTAAGTFTMNSLPKIGFNYTKNRTDYNLLQRRDDRDSYSGNMNYTSPLRFFALPNTISANYSMATSKVSYNAVELTTTAAAGLFNTNERNYTYGGKLGFTPWRGSSFNPGYSMQQVKEKRHRLSTPGLVERYPKSMQQTVEFNSNFMFFRWLNPSANYSITTTENNNLNTVTITKLSTSATFNVGEIKTVNRTAQGGVNLTLNVKDLLPRNRFLRSMILSSNYQTQDGDSWQNISKSQDLRWKLWLRDSFNPKGFFAQRNSLTLRDTVNSSQRWQPFEAFAFKGAMTPVRTISITNNFSNSVQRSEVTGTITKSVNRTFPDLIFSISQLEHLTRTTRWLQNKTVNLKYSKNTNETKLISLDLTESYGGDLRFKLLNYFDTAMSYNTRTTSRKDLRINMKVQSSDHQDATFQSAFNYGKFRFTPKVDFSQDIAKGGLGIVTQNTRVITPSLLIKADTQLPRGLKLPFIKRIFSFTNRITWTTTLSLAIKKSPITIADNNRLFTLNSSADYEAAKNLRLTFNAGIQRFWHRFLKEDEYISYQGGATLTFQF